jgi:toxin ParE1/3/4
MATIVVRSAARRDIDEIFVRIALDNFDAAVRVDDAIVSAFHMLADHPQAGALCGFSEADLADVRYWPVKKYRNYLVLYRPLPDGIDVARVIHAATDIRRAFGST